MNTSNELSSLAAAISKSQSASSVHEQRVQQAVLGQGTADITAQAAEFILRAMLRAYQEALLVEAGEDLKARKALATA